MRLLQAIIQPPTVPTPKPIKPPRKRLMSFKEFCDELDQLSHNNHTGTPPKRLFPRIR